MQLSVKQLVKYQIFTKLLQIAHIHKNHNFLHQLQVYGRDM